MILFRKSDFFFICISLFVDRFKSLFFPLFLNVCLFFFASVYKICKRNPKKEQTFSSFLCSNTTLYNISFFLFSFRAPNYPKENFSFFFPYSLTERIYSDQNQGRQPKANQRISFLPNHHR